MFIKGLIITLELLAAISSSGCGAVAVGPGQEPEKQVIESHSVAPETFEASDIKELDDTYNEQTFWLPENCERKMGEIEAYPELARIIATEYNIPEESYADTRYYYQYIDVEDDDDEELFCVVIGPYTSGTGGDSALLLDIDDEKLKVRQTFTLIRTPLLISDKGSESGKDIYYYRSGGGGKPSIVKLVNNNGAYTNPADAKEASVENVSGTAIICNDQIADLESETFLTLNDAISPKND